MRSFLAIIIAIFTAIWIYGSLNYYICIINQQCGNVRAYPVIEIAIMLLGTFIFGYIFGNLLSGNTKKKYLKRSQLNNVTGSYTKSKKYGLYGHSYNIDNKEDFYIDNKNSKISYVDKKLEISLKEENKEDINAIKKKNIDISKEEDKKGLLTSFLDDIKFDNDDKMTQKQEKTVQGEIIEKIQKTSYIEKNQRRYGKKDESILKVHRKNKKDDLTRIEGIGPKIEKLLNEKNIYSFADLANTDAYHITNVLSEAGTRFQMHNPKTWPKQAELARTHKWGELNTYQERLKGGKE